MRSLPVHSKLTACSILFLPPPQEHLAWHWTYCRNSIHVVWKEWINFHRKIDGQLKRPVSEFNLGILALKQFSKDDVGWSLKASQSITIYEHQATLPSSVVHSFSLEFLWISIFTTVNSYFEFSPQSCPSYLSCVWEKIFFKIISP